MGEMPSGIDEEAISGDPKFAEAAQEVADSQRRREEARKQSFEEVDSRLGDTPKAESGKPGFWSRLLGKRNPDTNKSDNSNDSEKLQRAA